MGGDLTRVSHSYKGDAYQLSYMLVESFVHFMDSKRLLYLNAIIFSLA